MKKRITALLLAFAMLFTLSAAALAADESALVPEPAAADPAAETPTPLPKAAEDKTEAPAEQLAAPRPVLRAVETAATHAVHHPYCGDKTCGKHGAAITEWTDLNTVTAGSTLEAGKAYYLTDNLNINSAFVVSSGEVNVCLNGKTISSTNARIFDVQNDGTLRICDCSADKSGTISGGYGVQGSAIFLRWKANTANKPVVQLYSGTVNSTSSNTSDTGGTVTMGTGTFIMEGGTISGGNAKKGGGVYVSSGTFTMNGGTITGCTATENGGGVYLNGGTFMVSGTATITGNHVGKADNNVYLPANKTITAAGLTSGTQIGVTTATKPNAATTVAITGANAADIHGCFTSDNSAYEPWNGDENTVVLRTARTTPTCDAPSGLTAVYGQKLSEIELTNPEGNTPGTWTWENGDQDVGNVGGHTFKATFTPTDGDSYKTVTGIDVTVTVEQADQTITISGKDHTIIRNGKPYTIDFATALGGAVITYSLESEIEGVALDTVNKTLTVQPSVTIATDITIKATATATENYKLASQTFTVTVAAKSDIELTITMDGWTYGETANTPTSASAPAGVTPKITYAVKGTEEFSDEVPTNVGEYVVKVVYETDTAIYFGTENFTIAKAAGAVTKPVGKDGLVYTGQAQELLETEATSATGTVQYKLDDGVWSETALTATDAGTYNVYYRSVGDENHESTADTAYITVEIAKKQIDVPAADDTAFTYTGENLTYTPGNLDAEHCTVAGNVQKDAGTHDVIVSLKDTANTEWKTGGTADKTYTFTIAQAKLTLRALDKKITAGQPAPDLSNPVLNEDYTVEGTLYGGDTLDITMAYDPADTSKAGTYTITIAAAAMANYDIATVSGTLTVEAVQTSQKLGISTPPRTPGGTLELTPKNAKPGDTVTITVKPDKGFELGGLTVRDVNGDKLDLVREGDNEFSFTMPKSSVKISASFVAENDDVLFRDVPTGAYFYDAVKWARQNGITDGIGDGLFGAAFPCTRAQIVTFLWRAAGSPEPQNDVTFTDVPSTAYYAKAVAWAVEAGITNGVGGNKFDPDAPCTRAQAVAFLYRAAGEPAVRSAAEFDDVAENAYYAAVSWAQRQSITDGVSATRFAPDHDCTRAQIVAFLYRVFAK